MDASSRVAHWDINGFVYETIFKPRLQNQYDIKLTEHPKNYFLVLEEPFKKTYILSEHVR